MKALLRKLFYRIIRHLVDKRDARVHANTTFPTNRGRNYLSEPLFPEGDTKGFYTKFYAEDVENPLTIDYKRFKTEILKAQLYPAGAWHEIACDVPSAIPYAVTNADYIGPRGNHSIDFRCNGTRFDFANLVSERFYYLPIREKSSVSFRCKHDLIIGQPLPLIQRDSHRHKLVLVLFVDNLGWDITRQYPLEDVMPNLVRFFSKGLIFNNFFVNSNWTLPSVSSMVSGKSLATHRMFHPRRDLVVGDGYPILSELFQQNGYMTFQACGNWRKSPRYGYAKGFDRTVYRNQMSLSDVLDSFLSNTQAFRERDNFAWLSIFDLHHPMALVPDIDVQVATPLAGHDYRVDHEKSPLQLEQNSGRTTRYLQEMKRVDFHLGPIFAWLEENYDDDEILVAVVSDHGTTFLTEDTNPLALERCHGAFMLRGGGVPAQRSDEFVQTEDLMPTLMQLCGLPVEHKVDGRVPEVLGGPPAREFAYSEIIYPGDFYRAVVRDNDFDFYAESVNPVDDDGRVNIAETTSRLYHKDNPGADISADNPARCDAFKHIVRRHVSTDS